MGRDSPHILLLAHGFPPAGGGGVQRPAKLAKYLPRLGWRVSVLTTQAELYRELHGLYDPSLLEEVPPEVEILRVPSRESEVVPPKRIGVPGLDRLRFKLWWWRQGPEASWDWCRRALPAAEREVRASRSAVVLGTGGPFSTFLLARKLSRRTGVPYVLDFRDAWCVRDWAPERRPDARHRRWERRALSGAARAVFVTQRMCDLSAEAYPHLAVRFRVIENGVDLEEPWRSEPTRVSRERFEIVYTGRFTPERSPEVFLRGLAQAKTRSGGFASRARLVVAGVMGATPRTLRANHERIADLGLAGRIEERGYLPHAEAVRLQCSAGALLSVVGKGASAAGGKSYEYLAAGRPVLALAPRGGEAERVLSRGVMTVLVDPHDPEDAAAKLLDLFGRWERGELFDLPAPEVPVELTRAHQARQMAEILDAAAAERAGGRARDGFLRT